MGSQNFFGDRKKHGRTQSLYPLVHLCRVTTDTPVVRIGTATVRLW